MRTGSPVTRLAAERNMSGLRSNRGLRPHVGPRSCFHPELAVVTTEVPPTIHGLRYRFSATSASVSPRATSESTSPNLPGRRRRGGVSRARGAPWLEPRPEPAPRGAGRVVLPAAPALPRGDPKPPEVEERCREPHAPLGFTLLRQDAGQPEGFFQLGELPLAPDEAGRLRRKPAHAPRPPRRRFDASSLSAF